MCGEQLGMVCIKSSPPLDLEYFETERARARQWTATEQEREDIRRARMRSNLARYVSVLYLALCADFCRPTVGQPDGLDGEQFGGGGEGRCQKTVCYKLNSIVRNEKNDYAENDFLFKIIDFPVLIFPSAVQYLEDSKTTTTTILFVGTDNITNRVRSLLEPIRKIKIALNDVHMKPHSYQTYM